MSAVISAYEGCTFVLGVNTISLPRLSSNCTLFVK